VADFVEKVGGRGQPNFPRHASVSAVPFRRRDNVRELLSTQCRTKREKAMTRQPDGAFLNDLTLVAEDICNALQCEEPSLPLGYIRNRSAHETAISELLKARGLESLSRADAARFALTLALAVVKLARADLLLVRANSRAARP
jgi:hypothetical protein